MRWETVAACTSDNAVPLLLDGLKRLEYRGYDSAGMAVQQEGLAVHRVEGRVETLSERVEAESVRSPVGIAHTRWATHGAPSQINAHPQTSNDVAVVHNGIIENFESLRDRLSHLGYRFRSQMDTEVVAHLIQAQLDGAWDGHRYEGLLAAVIAAKSHLEGAYALAVISANDANTIVLTREGSPLVLSVSDQGTYAASDTSALLALTREMMSLDNGDSASISATGYQLTVLRLAAALDQRCGKFSGLRTYVHQMCFPELLSAPLSLNVAEWDGDTVGDIAELIDTSRNWASATWTVFWAALSWFVRYAQSLGYAEEVTVPGANQGAHASIYRCNLLRSPAVDALVRDCFACGQEGPEGLDVGLMIALAYYVGSRSGELAQLTLADVVVDESDEPVAFSTEQLQRLLGSVSVPGADWDSLRADNAASKKVYINVLWGKTAAARRCIPLHALAPQWVVSALTDYWREQSQRARRLDKTPLFAPHRYVGGYKRELTRLAIEALQRRYGNGRDLHLLRHCAASNLALRIHSLMHPEFRQQLAEREHDLFSDAYQRLLQAEMENPLGAALWEDGTRLSLDGAGACPQQR